MNPDTIGYVWTGEYDLNTLRVDGEIFESGTKTLRISPDKCGQGLNLLFSDGHVAIVVVVCLSSLILPRRGEGGGAAFFALGQ